MAHINLLPWREELRKEKQREFISIAFFAAILGGILVFYAHIHMNGLIDYQNQRNQYLENEIKLVDQKIAQIKQLEATKKALIDRMNIIQQLQVSRPGVVHLFDELVKTLPEGIYLTSMTESGKKLSIAGMADSNARVSAYMRNLDAAPWLTNPKLAIIQVTDKEGRRLSRFTLTVDQTTPDAKKKQQGANKR
ncbi:MAG: PilN domain-containing protein [Gammaproteobacteria bacterium]|jgi:type IV pilus assembly protein PilN